MQCIRQSRMGLTTLNWRRRFDTKDEWGCRNPNTGIRKWLVENSGEHGKAEQGEKQSENEDDNARDKDSVSVLRGLWVSDDSVSLSLESLDLDDDSVMESVLTKTAVERNVRSRHETTDAKQEIKECGR